MMSKLASRRYIIIDGLALLLVIVAVFWKLALTNLIIARGDVLTYFYPYLDYAAQATRQGRLPLWNPYLFMGVPFLANSQAGFFYPFNRLLSWLPVTRAVNLTLILHTWLAGLGAYTFARRSLNLRRAAAWAAGAAFAIGGYLTAQVEHVNQLQGLAWLPWLFVCYDLSISHRHRLAWVGLSATVALQLFAGHTQTAFISLVGLGIYALATTPLRPWQTLLGRMARLAGAVLLGAGLAAAQLVPTLELAQFSMRSGGLGWREAVSFSLNPLLLGRALLPSYWQSIFSEYIAYVGLAGLMLAAIGLSSDKRNQVRAMAVLAGLGLFFALGGYNPLYLLLAKFAPGFGLFRVPARWLALYAFGTAMLIGLGLEALQSASQQIKRRSLVVWGTGIAGLLLLAWLGARLPVPGTGQPIGLPGKLDWIGWLAGASLATLLIWQRPRWSAAAAIALMLAELLAAGTALPFNRATAPEALDSLRPSLLLLKSEGADSRFISLSDIFFDPGDKTELESAFADQLNEAAFYDLLVATKQKEIVAPNLPLYYRLASADGFDGGILPLRDYVAFQQLLLPPGQTASPDGRLREVLREVPESKWLSLMNVRHIITDKTMDAWIDNVFYDLQFGTAPGPNYTATVARVPRFQATALGVVSHLQGAAQLTQGTSVAQLVIGFEDGMTQTYSLRAGVETAEGVYTGSIAHQAAQVGGHFVRDQPQVNDYVVRLSWDKAKTVTSVQIIPSMITNQLVIRGMTLIDERTGGFQPLVVSGRGRFALVHSGDVKIYENLDVLPRAFAVSEARFVEDQLAAMRDPAFDPTRQVILDPPPPGLKVIEKSDSYEVTTTLVLYQPEHVIVDVQNSAGWLVLTDSYYPGWRALIDGQPAPLFRADLLFRAVPVVGTHRVEFIYDPLSIKVGIGISLLALALACWLVWRGRRLLQFS